MKLTALILFLFAFSACTNNQAANSKKTNISVKLLGANVTIPIVKYGIEVFYTGPFIASKFDDTVVLDNKITICIDSLNNTTVFGHSVLAGNYRLFEGQYKKRGQDYLVTAKEPGDNKSGGMFDFTIDTYQEKIYGSWQANDISLAVKQREYKLERTAYKYDSSLALMDEIVGEPIYGTYDKKTEKEEALTKDVMKVNASSTLLNPSDVENMFQGDLEVLRNSIYARHGYSFKNPRMRTIFDYVPWYMPVATDVTSQLTEVEKKNIALIRRYEKHAAKYYDSFGR